MSQQCTGHTVDIMQGIAEGVRSQAKHNAAEYTVLHCGGDLAAYLCRHVSLYGQLAQATGSAGSDGDDDRILMR